MDNIYLVMTTGRTGSDYLCACLDNVDGIMTFTGKFDYHALFPKNSNEVDKNYLLNSFIKKYDHLFNYNNIEDINPEVNKEKFKKIFLEISPFNKLNKKDFLVNIYKALHITLNRNIKNVKALVHHAHGIDNVKKCLKDFPNSKIFITIRDPRANLKSGISNWFNFDSKRIHMSHVDMYIRRIREDLKFALSLKNKKLFIKLEEAGENSTKKNICNFLNINYDNNIELATINSKPWNGDKLSTNKSQDGKFNKSVINKDWINYFSSYELKFLNLIYRDYKKFGYNIEKINNIEKLKIFGKIIKKLSFEKKTFEINHNTYRYFSNYYYFMRRIIYSVRLLIIN